MSEVPRAWPDVQRWRTAERKRLMVARAGAPAAVRGRHTARILELLEPLLDPSLELACYWPYRFEVDVRPLMERLCARGARVSLPVVAARDRPLEFRRWRPGVALERNALGIPVPAAGATVCPDVVLAPLLGFDADNYRLGLGGGYFDRTLAQPDVAPHSIGVGFELSRLDTIHPQPHDIPVDQVVTEAGVQDRCHPRRHGDGPAEHP